MIRFESGAGFLGYGSIRACQHCHNKIYEHVKQHYEDQSMYFIKYLKKRGDVFVLCSICEYGYKIDKKDTLRIAQVLWAGRQKTREWFQKIEPARQKYFLSEYQKLGLTDLILFVRGLTS